MGSVTFPIICGGLVFLQVITILPNSKHVSVQKDSTRGLIKSVGAALPGFASGSHAKVGRGKEDPLKEMPELLDIVTLGLSAGLSFDAALELYCERYDTLLSKRFSQAVRCWQMGIKARSEALDDLASELDVAAIRRFSSAVTEALTFGSPLASVLDQQAQAIRSEQRSQIEEQIEKAPVKMLIPMGTLIVPAMLLAILGPLLAMATSVG